MLVVCMMLAACSGGTTEENVAAGTAGATTEGAASLTDEAEDANRTKVVQDQFGEVTIPAHPQNLIVFDSIYAEYLIEMGLHPKWFC